MPALAEYLHDLAEQCGEYGSFSTTSLGTTTTLISTSFVNSTLSSTELTTMWVLCESGSNAGEVRRVTPSGLNTSTGTITVAEAFTNAVASGVTFSLYGHLPPFRRLNRAGYREAINQALRLISVQDVLTISGITGTEHYLINQAGYPWWTAPDRVIAVENPLDADGNLTGELPYNQWDWRAVGELLYLHLPGAPYKTGESFTVRLYRPANTLLKVAGAWVDQTAQTSGLSGLTDEAIPDVADVTPVARHFAYNTMAKMRAPITETAEWLAERKVATRAARKVLRTAVPEDRTAGVVRFRPVVAHQR